MYIPNFKVVAAENFELCGRGLIDLNAANRSKFAIVRKNKLQMVFEVSEKNINP